MTIDQVRGSAMDDGNSSHAAVEQVLAVLTLNNGGGARTTEDIFTAISQHMRHGRIYGGQVLAQAVVAAQHTVPPERSIHSLHGYFLRPGDTSQGLTLSVDRIHDGRSFATRRAQAYQNGVPIWSMISSFQDGDPGVEHAIPMPEGIPAPEDLAATDRPDTVTTDAGRRGGVWAVELRHVEKPLWLDEDPLRASRQHVWMRMRAPLPDDAGIHRAALAYMSDLTIQESVLRASGVSWSTPGLKVASLDHGMWWHRFARADDWILYAQESPSARGGRGLATGRMYTRDGMLVASVTQEIMVRVPETHA